VRPVIEPRDRVSTFAFPRKFAAAWLHQENRSPICKRRCTKCRTSLVVYLMRDRFNRVIYVGKARDLRKRVGSYFLPSKLAQADLKTRAMLETTWDFETHTVRSDAESVCLRAN